MIAYIMLKSGYIEQCVLPCLIYGKALAMAAFIEAMEDRAAFDHIFDKRFCQSDVDCVLFAPGGPS